MNEQLIILCPGQGAQAISMAKAWCDQSKEARAVFDEADQILDGRLGSPLSELCFNGPSEILNRTDISQPAIYTASIASWRGLLAQWNDDSDQINLAATAGLSLGEYTALHIAGAFSFADGLELVTLRGRAMQDAARASPGGMVALIGADEEKARQVCDAARADDILVCANFNAPGQVVLSGTQTACDRAAQAATDVGLRAAPLPVAGAFHSPLMAPAADQLAEALSQTEILTPSTTVLANVTGTPHAAQGEQAITDEIRKRLVEQLTQPVRWADCCTWMAANVRGTFHELAPGKTLAGLMRRIERSIKVQSHNEPTSKVEIA